MRRSWASFGSSKTQESSENESSFEISSFIRSLTQKRCKLPSTHALRNELAPRKSLSEIVSRISNCIEPKPVSLAEQTRDFFKSQNTKHFNNEEKNSRTKSMQAFSRPSTKKNEKLDYMIFPNNTSGLNKSAELVEIFSQSMEEKRSSCGTALERIGSNRWGGSSTSFSSQMNHNFDGFSMRSSTSRNLMPSASIIDFKNELWPTNSSFFISSNDSLRLLSSLNSREFKHVSDRLVEIPTRDNIDFLPIKLEKNTTKNNKEDEITNDDKIFNPVEVKHLGKKSKMRVKFSTKRKFSHRGKIKKLIQTPSIPSYSSVESKSNDIDISVERESKILNRELNYDNEKQKATDKINPPDEIMNCICSTDNALALKVEEKIPELQTSKKKKLDQVKSRYKEGISRPSLACAKESKMTIPQSTRFRAIFRPLAGIQEPSEVSIVMTKGNADKKSIDDSKCTSLSSNSKESKKGKKTPSVPNPIWRPGGLNSTKSRQILETRNKSQNQKPFEKKNLSGDKDSTQGQNNVPVLRSKTCIPEKTQELCTEAPDEKIPEIEKNSTVKNRHLKSFKMLKEILSYHGEKDLQKKSKESSENYTKDSKTLLEKLTSLSETSSSEYSTTCPDSEIVKEKEQIQELMEKTLKQDNECQTLRQIENTQSFQTEIPIAGAIENKKCNVSTETENDSTNIPKNIAHVKIHSQVDAQASCNINSGLNNLTNYKCSEISLDCVKSSRVIETQTSKTLFQKEKRNASMETIKVRVKSEQVNTDKKILIDTGSCTYQPKITLAQTRNIASQAGVSLDIKNTCIEKPIVNPPTEMTCCEKIVSSFSKELESSKRRLVLDCHKYSTQMIEQQADTTNIPVDVIKAFLIAAERAQNLQRAIEICRQNQTYQSQSHLSKDNIKNSEKIFVKNQEQVFQQDLEKFRIQQEVQILLEDLLDQVEKQIEFPDTFFESRNENLAIEASHPSIISNNTPRKYSMSRRIVLPIVYGAVCSFVYWSLQFSMSCLE